jgi:hypothetical protein
MLELDEKQEEINLKYQQTATLKEMSPSDWRKPYIKYLLFGKIISDNLSGEENERISNGSQFFAIMKDILMRQFVPKKCISDNRIQVFLKELHGKYQIREEMIKEATQ